MRGQSFEVHYRSPRTRPPYLRSCSSSATQVGVKRMVTVVYGFDNRRHVARILVCVALLGVVGALTPGLLAQLAIPAQLPSIPAHLQNSSSSTTAQTPIMPPEQLSPEERG